MRRWANPCVIRLCSIRYYESQYYIMVAEIVPCLFCKLCRLSAAFIVGDFICLPCLSRSLIYWFRRSGNPFPAGDISRVVTKNACQKNYLFLTIPPFLNILKVQRNWNQGILLKWFSVGGFSCPTTSQSSKFDVLIIFFNDTMSAPINGFLTELCQNKFVNLSAIVSDNACLPSNCLRNLSFGNDLTLSTGVAGRRAQDNNQEKSYGLGTCATRLSLSESRWSADGKNPVPTSAPRMPLRKSSLLSPITTYPSKRKNPFLERKLLSISILL